MLQDDLSSLGLHQSQPVIYDRPIGLRLLYRDAESGAAAHTIILLEGVMEADGQLLHAGS